MHVSLKHAMLNTIFPIVWVNPTPPPQKKKEKRKEIQNEQALELKPK